MHTVAAVMLKSEVEVLAQRYNLGEFKVSGGIFRVEPHLSAITRDGKRFAVMVSMQIAREQNLPLWSSSREAERVGGA